MPSAFPPDATVFDSFTALESFLSAEGRDGVRLVPAAANVVGVHFQMAKRRLHASMQHRKRPDDRPPWCEVNGWTLMAIAISAGRYSTPSAITKEFEGVENVVLDLRKLNRPLVLRVVRALLEDESTVKVLFDVHQAACWLHTYGLTQVALAKCVDAQLAFEVLGSGRQRGVDLATVYKVDMALDHSTVGARIKSLLDFKRSAASNQPTSADNSSKTMEDDQPATGSGEQMPPADTTGLTSMARMFPMLLFEELRYYTLRRAGSGGSDEHPCGEALAEAGSELSLAQVIAKWYLADSAAK